MSPIRKLTTAFGLAIGLAGAGAAGTAIYRINTDLSDTYDTREACWQKRHTNEACPREITKALEKTVWNNTQLLLTGFAAVAMGGLIIGAAQGGKPPELPRRPRLPVF
jgi:hypothetical protein